MTALPITETPRERAPYPVKPRTVAPPAIPYADLKRGQRFAWTVADWFDRHFWTKTSESRAWRDGVVWPLLRTTRVIPAPFARKVR